MKLLKEYYLGMDPSYKGFGLCGISIPENNIILGIKSVNIPRLDYNGFYNSASALIVELKREGWVFFNDSSEGKTYYGVESPSPRGQMAPALSGLFFLLMKEILSCKGNAWYFHTMYLTYLMKARKYSRTDVVNYATVLLDFMRDLGFKVIKHTHPTYKEIARGRRIKNDMLVAFLFALRLVLKNNELIREQFKKKFGKDPVYDRIFDVKERMWLKLKNQ